MIGNLIVLPFLTKVCLKVQPNLSLLNTTVEMVNVEVTNITYPDIANNLLYLSAEIVPPIGLNKQESPWLGKEESPWLYEEESPWLYEEKSPWLHEEKSPWLEEQQTPWLPQYQEEDNRPRKTKPHPQPVNQTRESE